VREACGWGDTQLKVHLARLVDLELLAAHRSERGSFAYELAWRGEGTDGATFLPGLTDPTTLGEATTLVPPAGPVNGYDPDRSGPAGVWSGGGRGPVGTRSAVGRTGSLGSSPQANGHTRVTDPAQCPERTTGARTAATAIPVDGEVPAPFTDTSPPAVNDADTNGTVVAVSGGR
jgi:hypothetical protein